MNNLDPEVAERPDDLVVYGGSGRAARSWAAFDAIVDTLRRLEHDETLVVQSGKPVAVFRTHPWSPRVIIANALLVPAWATWDTFRDLEDRGLTMYGQMTAGSWIYIGTQGILQGTYETLAELARRHFGGSLAGRLVVTAGLGGMGGAQPLAVTMNGGVALVVEVDPPRIERRLATRYVDERASNLDDALARVERYRARAGRAFDRARGKRRGRPARARAPRHRARRLTDQTSAHDALNGYVPDGMTLADAESLRRSRTRTSTSSARWRRWRSHVRAMLALQAAGAVTFDYGNNIRAQAQKAGVADAFEIPGFVPEYIRPLFCEGKGPFRWAALSGDAADIAATDALALEMFADNAALVPMDSHGARARGVPGPARAHLLARLRRTRAVRSGHQRPGPARRRQGADRHRPRSSRRRVGGVAESRDRGHARWQRCDRRLADPERAAQRLVGAPPGCRFITAVASASAIRSTRGWSSWPTAPARRTRNLQRVLTCDPGLGVVRHADAGYPEAIDTARRTGIDMPSLSCTEGRGDDDSGASVARTAGAGCARRFGTGAHAHPGRARRLWHRADVAAAAPARPHRPHVGTVRRRRTHRDDA